MQLNDDDEVPPAMRCKFAKAGTVGIVCAPFSGGQVSGARKHPPEN